jgi:methionine-gamma-lyase
MTTDRTTRQLDSRPDKHEYATLDDQTWFVHRGNRADDTTGAIRTPIVMANSYQLPQDPTTVGDPGYHGFVYTREHGANQLGLERKLAPSTTARQPPSSAPAWPHSTPPSSPC